LAALLVGIAQFAWQVYRDLKKDRVEASAEAIARQVRLNVELPPQVTAADRDRLIAAVVAEVRAAPER
jgi:uncharacterized membrane protein YebE (DUF533 family)